MSSQINPINPDIARLFRARLQEGETVLWQSQPDPLRATRGGALSGRATVFMFLLGLLWLRILSSIAFSQPAALLNPSLWSPFVLIAAVLAWGAWSAYRSALRTGYAVTDRRLLLALSGKEPIFSGREREAWGYAKLSVAASGVGTVTLAPSASARANTYAHVGDAAGLFNFVAGGTDRPVSMGQNLLPLLFDPAQVFLAPGERVLWQAEADADLLARALAKNALTIATLLGVITFPFMVVFLVLLSPPPPAYLLCLPALLALGTASWFLIRRWAGREAALTAADRFYALTDRRLVIARRTSRTEIVQFALDRLEVRESIPGQHKIRLRTARGDDPEVQYVADSDEAYALLTEAVARAKRERFDAPSPAMTPEDNSEPDLSGEDPFRKQLRRGEEMLWRGDSKGGGRQTAAYGLTRVLG